MSIFDRIFKRDVSSTEDTKTTIHDDNGAADSSSITENKLKPLVIVNKYPDRFTNVLYAIVQTYGAEYLLNPLSINVLSDYNAFEKNKAYKYIFKALLNDRIIARLFSVSAWDEKCERCIYKYITETGFKEELVSQIIYSVFLSLSKVIPVKERIEAKHQPLINEETDEESSQPTNSKPTPAQPPISPNYPWTKSLTQLVDNLYLRQDWFDRSPVEFQDLKVVRDNQASQYIVDFDLLARPGAKLYADTAFGNDNKDKICFYLLWVDKNNDIVSVKHLYNTLSGVGSSLTWMSPSTFEQYRLAIDIPKESGDKLIICVEYGFEVYCSSSNDIINTRNYRDITNLVHFPNSVGDEFSFVRFYNLNQKVKVYLERDSALIKTKLHGDFHSHKIRIINHEGKLKGVTSGLSLWFGMDGMDKHYHITNEFDINIPIQDISKIELIRE